MARKLITTKPQLRTPSLREKMVDLVFEYAGDEFETVQDVFELAKETEEELLSRISNILEYYKYEAER